MERGKTQLEHVKNIAQKFLSYSTYIFSKKRSVNYLTCKIIFLFHSAVVSSTRIVIIKSNFTFLFIFVRQKKCKVFRPDQLQYHVFLLHIVKCVFMLILG